MTAANLSGLASQPTSLKIGKEIKRGPFGVVYDGELNGKPVAVRKMYPLPLRGKEHSGLTSQIVEEALLMKQLNHARIVKFMEVYYSKDGPVVVMERMQKNLRQYLTTFVGKLSRERQIDMCFQIADAVHYLHSQQPPVVRRNISQNTIWFTPDGKVKLGGCTYVARLPPSGFFVDPLRDLYPYVPAEALTENAHYNEKVDIFSLGVVMLQVTTQRFPYVNQSDYGRHSEDLTLLPEDHPLKPIILQCLRDDPGERPDSGTVLRMLSEGETCKVHVSVYGLPSVLTC